MSLDFENSMTPDDSNSHTSIGCDLIVRSVTDQAAETRASIVRHRLGYLKGRQSECNFEISILLREVHEQQLWKETFPSFKAYVEAVVEMKLRTVQDMLRTLRKCEEVGIGAEEIRSFGWSKVSVVAAHLNAENIEQCLKDLELCSFGELRKQYGRSRGPKWEANAKNELIITECITAAMNQAASETGVEDNQFNLEHVARRFIEMANAMQQWELIAMSN